MISFPLWGLLTEPDGFDEWLGLCAAVHVVYIVHVEWEQTSRVKD